MGYIVLDVQVDTNRELRVWQLPENPADSVWVLQVYTPPRSRKAQWEQVAQADSLPHILDHFQRWIVSTFGNIANVESVSVASRAVPVRQNLLPTPRQENGKPGYNWYIKGETGKPERVGQFDYLADGLEQMFERVIAHHAPYDGHIPDVGECGCEWCDRFTKDC